MPHDTVHVHADESCLGNQFQDRANPGGAGGLVEVWRGGEWIRRAYWVAELDTTNNRMALISAIEPLGALKRPCAVPFVSDSQYLVKGHAGHPRNEYANDLAILAAKEQTNSGGLVASGFEAWLDNQRGRGRYLDFKESLPPA